MRIIKTAIGNRLRVVCDDGSTRGLTEIEVGLARQVNSLESRLNEICRLARVDDIELIPADAVIDGR
jgi:hypothetical protein